MKRPEIKWEFSAQSKFYYYDSDSASKYFDHLEQQVDKLKAALEFYADKEKWAMFVSDGNIFDEADGDMLESFLDENGPDHGATARATLKELEQE